MSEVYLNKNIYIIINLFDKVKDMINENEHFKVANLFLIGGKKVMTSLVSDKVYKYFKSCISLLDENS